jgi:hypothetical protein
MPASDGGVFERSHLVNRHDTQQRTADLLSETGVSIIHVGAHEDAECDHIHKWV